MIAPQTSPVIKVADIAYVRLRSPDLDRAQTFLSDFGLVVAERTERALYMRGTGTSHHVHITEFGEPAFAGIGFLAESADDLERLARVDGASAVEAIDEPGGGRRVRLRDPHGFQIEVVHGIEAVEALPVEQQVMNAGSERRRHGVMARPPRGPSRVKRIGHAVLKSSDVKAALAWYRSTLGFVSSDDVYAGDPSNIIGSFNRCDRGETFVDHHTLFIVEGDTSGLNHVAFEVECIDDVMYGHEHLRDRDYRHVWGVGRHLLGSQIFDYWSDPWGRVHEHWTDGDLLNDQNGSNLLPAEIGLTSQWGIDTPPEFAAHAS